ncbi:hypothetical protein [Wolbachia endosymbiont of Trichogramma pretiosum]|uniref:hypothetical protein n=1 Tax=Wolbachia endosymbiont of Trichogramma pretiosum TaxID=125593 RepID=UPI001FDFA507|nr:hypothetical protein [Wolbachia endosymbiont of Trichogramma pretiosum]OCA06604.1 hypothetical protein wTpre_944 [Wolbachia endosymbiont of Trichogramma pretiosum]
MNKEVWLYGVLFNVLCKVDEDNDLDVNNIIKNKGFDVNHRFDLKDYDDFPIDSLFFPSPLTIDRTL